MTDAGEGSAARRRRRRSGADESSAVPGADGSPPNDAGPSPNDGGRESDGGEVGDPTAPDQPTAGQPPADPAETEAADPTGPCPPGTGRAHAWDSRPTREVRDRAEVPGRPETPRTAPVRSGPDERRAVPRERGTTRSAPGGSRDSERGWRDLAGNTPSLVGISGGLRARDAARPRPEDVAAAERDVTVIRRQWQPPDKSR